MREFRRGVTMTKAIFASAPSGTSTTVGGGEWTTLGPGATVEAGDIKAFPSPGGVVAVANVGGTYYGFDDTCTHKRCSLAEGDLDGTVVTCICHGSQFDVTSGAVKRGPAEAPVGSYPVRLEGSDLQVRR
jgi:nitrite reductase/ring-hydroxylating ferredoxin subunit